MSETKLCRICLRTNAKIFDYDNYQLKYYYEQVMAKTVNDSDGLPHTFCFECATLLHKFHKFKEKCYKGEKALKDILKSGQKTIKSALNRDIKRLNLQSPLQIVTANKRIKTYIVKHKTKISDLIIGSEEKKVENIEIVIDNGDLMSDHGDNVDSDDIPCDREELIDFSTLDDKHLDPIKEEKAIELIKEEDLEDIMTLSEVKKSIKTENVTAEPEIESEDDNTCTEVFCDVEKEVEMPMIKAVTKKKKSRNEKLYQKSSKFYKKERKGLDPANWNQINLSESEALKAFHARSEEPKYLAAPFKCYNCYKPFLKQETLNRHIQLTHRESLGTLECRFCRMRFKWKCYLTRHTKKHYTKFECQRCPFVCAMESTAFLHEEAHSGVKIKCKYCVEEFRHRSTYYTHLRNHRSDYVCSLCGASFVSEAGVHMHKRVKHVDVIQAEEVTEEKKEVRTFCVRCDIAFETEVAYEQHLLHSASHAGGKEMGDDKNKWKDFNQGKRKRRRRKRSPCLRNISEDGKDSSMYCERCDIRFETQKAYEQHFLHSALHPGGLEAPDDERIENELKLFRNGKKRGGIRRRKPTTCRHCNVQFETQSSCFKHHLAEHPRTPFSAERQICEICGASLAPNSIASHLNTHTRAILHTCDTCGKQFSTNMVLKRHQVTHTGQKPYPCTHCEKRFTQKNSMELHFRTFHLKQPYPKRNRKKKTDSDELRMEMESDGS